MFVPGLPGLLPFDPAFPALAALTLLRRAAFAGDALALGRGGRAPREQLSGSVGTGTGEEVLAQTDGDEQVPEQGLERTGRRRR